MNIKRFVACKKVVHSLCYTVITDSNAVHLNRRSVPCTLKIKDKFQSVFGEHLFVSFDLSRIVNDDDDDDDGDAHLPLASQLARAFARVFVCLFVIEVDLYSVLCWTKVNKLY